MPINLLEQLNKALIGDDGFLMKIRMGEGFDQSKFDSLCNLLKACGREWAGKDELPKRLVGLLIDISPIMYASLGFYKEDMREKIKKAEADLYDIIIDNIL